MRMLLACGVMALGVAFTTGPARALTSGQLKCQENASKTVAKFVGSKSGCLNKCWAGVRKADASKDCAPSGGRDATTQDCINAAEGKSNDGQIKKCGAACPHCYSGGDCTADASSKTNTAEGLIDTQDNGAPGSLHCGTTSSTTKAVGGCQDNASKVLVKFLAALSKCTQKCKANEAKGKAAAGSCAPPATDPSTIACISAAKGKCVSGVDKKCGPNTPACWGAAVNDGNEWCSLVQTILDGLYGSYFCASPSGAFLE